MRQSGQHFCAFSLLFLLVFFVVLPQHVNENVNVDHKEEVNKLPWWFVFSNVLPLPVQTGLPFWKQNKENFEFSKISYK